MNSESHESRTTPRPETHPRPQILGLVGEVCLRLGWPGHLDLLKKHSRSGALSAPDNLQDHQGVLTY